MMNISQQQAHLFALGYYKLTRKDGSPAIDGVPGPATKQAIYNFQLAHKKRPDATTLSDDGIWGPNTERALREVIGNDEAPQFAPKPDRHPSHADKYKWIRVEDFKCRCGKYCDGWPAQPHEATLDLLEQIGEHFQSRIIPHSGLRCKRWNSDPSVGGAPTSKHLYGMAMDFHIDGVSHREVYNYADKLLGNSGGLGLYPWGIHIDDRPVRGRW